MTFSRTPSPHSLSRTQAYALTKSPSTSGTIEVTGIQNSTEKPVCLHNEVLTKSMRASVIQSHGNYKPLEVKASLDEPIPPYTSDDFREFVVRCVKNGMTAREVLKVVRNRYSEPLCDDSELQNWARTLNKDKIQHWTQAVGVKRGLSIKHEQAAKLIGMKYSYRATARMLKVSPITISRWVSKTKTASEKPETRFADECSPSSSKLAFNKPRYHNDASVSTTSSESEDLS